MMWGELRHTVRCIYRKAGTELAIDHMLDVEKMKSLVHKLCARGPQQLYQQLETQGREYVEEVKFHLLEHLLCHPSSIGIPQHAREFAQTLLDEYEQLLCATVTLQSFLMELEDEHMAQFGITWMLVNQHLFHQVVYSDPIIQKSLPGVCIQLKYGEVQQTPNTKFESYTSVYYRLKSFEEEMVLVEQTWIRAIVSLASFVNEKTLTETHEEWEFLGIQHLMYAREHARESRENAAKEEAKTDAIPSSLLGHKKLFIKHGSPKVLKETLKNVKVDQLSSGSIEIKAEDSSCVCDCAACSTLMGSLVSCSPIEDESSPLAQNWVQIPDDVRDAGCDSSTQTIDDVDDVQSERRLSTSSVSSKDSTDKPKYCACCYCELVGHTNPSTHNSHNYEIFREKLRKKLEFKRNPEKAKRELCAEHQNNFNITSSISSIPPKSSTVVDNRSVEELVSFIEGPKDGNEPKRRKRRSKAKEQPKNDEKTDNDTKEDFPRCDSVESDKMSVRNETPPQPNKTNEKPKDKANPNTTTAQTQPAQKLESLLSDIDPKTNECVFRKMLNQKRVEMENFSFHLEKFRNLTQEQKIELLYGKRIDNQNLYQKQQDLLKSINLPKELALKVKEEEEREMIVAAENKIAGSQCKKEEAENKAHAKQLEKNAVITKKKYKKKKKRKESLDDIFSPKCDINEMDYMDESERELEKFKRFCMDTQPLKTRQKIQLNWKSVNLNSKKPI